MKYAIFALTCLGLVPVALLCAVSRRSFNLLAVALLVPVVAYVPTSLNPISFEDYRGTARGYEISLIYLIAFTILLALLLKRKRISFTPGWGGKLYLLYFVWSCLALQNSSSMLYSGAEVWKMVMIWAVYAAVYGWLCVAKDPRPVLVGLGFAIIGTFYIIARQHLAGVWQVAGPFMHQNSLAVFLVLAVPVYFSYYLNADRGAKGWWFFALVFFLGSGCLIRTYSRGAIACYPISCLVVLLLSVRHKIKIQKLLRLVPLGLLGLLGFLAILPRIVARFEHAPKSSGETRVAFARAALNMIRDQPVFGVGLNCWGMKINPPYTYWIGTGCRKNDDPNNPDMEFKDGVVETVYLLVCAECGIPCLAIMLVWYGYNLVSCLRLTKRLAGTPWFFLPVGLAGGLTATYLQSTLEWVLKQAVNFTELMVFFALVSFMNAHWQELRGDAAKTPGALPPPKRKPAVVPHHLQLDPVEHD